MDVLIASAHPLPEPDPDEAPLLASLAAAGIVARVAPWHDPDVDWSAAGVVLIRSTWNYYHRVDDFVAWARRVGERLHNPPDVVAWNAHKRYLLDLAAAGVPAVPTRLLGRGDATSLAAVLDAADWDDVVVKPAVSAASFRTLRTGRTAEGEAHLRALVAERDTLVQPYLRSVEGYGERSLVWIDGELTHAVRKSPRFQSGHEAVSEAVPIAEDEALLARRALAAVPEPLLYARIDIARDAAGAPCVMELELIEPSLFLRQAPWALERLVAAVRRRVSA